MLKTRIIRYKAYLALTITAIIWGAAFPIIKPAFEFVTPIQYLYLRFLVAGICALPIFLWYYLRHRPKLAYILKVLAIELFGLPIPLLLLYYGLDQTSALEASLLGSLTPLFVTIGGITYLREKQSNREWQGLALALFGSILIVLEPLLNGHGVSGSSISGNLLILGYNALYTIYVLVAKKTYKQKPPVFFGALTYLGTALIYGLILLANNNVPQLDLLTNSSVLIPTLYMAIPGGILAFALYLYGLSKIEASEANLFTYLNGVVAIPVAAMLLHEYPTPVIYLAVALILYGVFRAESKKSSH